MQTRKLSEAASHGTVCSRAAVASAHRQRAGAVSFLTRRSPISRLFDVFFKSGSSIVAMILLLGCGSFAAAATKTPWHAVEDITSTAEDFVRDLVGTSDNRITPEAGSIDGRLQLPRCSQSLDAFHQRGAKVTSRMIVGVRCGGSSPWKIYVPVDVVVTESVLTARRSLPAGHIFEAKDMLTDERDVSRLVGGYLSDPGNLIGKQLKHSLIAGRVITPSMLKAHIMIRRGQSVTIMARGDAVNIRMTGVAMADGAENQRIRVENTLSKRVIEGIVRSPEHVEVLVY